MQRYEKREEKTLAPDTDAMVAANLGINEHKNAVRRRMKQSEQMDENIIFPCMDYILHKKKITQLCRLQVYRTTDR